MSFKITAIKNIVPKICYFHDDVPYDKNENLITYDEAKVNAEITRLQKEWDANQYQRDRASAYPSWQDQMDLLYHGGVDALKAELKKTKDKFPKPE